MTHTPGPWKAHHYRIDDKDHWDVRSEDGTHITGWGRVTQPEANARLIAAAPEMLAALKAHLDNGLVVDALSLAGLDDELNAIAKAIADAEPK